ncbi:MAG: DUF1211 domain-containing protein [Sphingobacteriaceae bacterium]|nr:DUF1211 domain-containing protein [Cytophagaceae bacterium]
MENSGHDPTARVVSFSDGVFGFALTLLVFPFETPTRFAQVVDFVQLGLAYALGAALIAMIWWEHNRFFRLFRGMDRALVALNTALLFVMLVFVYPLKFLAVYLENLFLGQSNSQLISRAEVPTLMMLYGGCFGGTCLLLFLMHRYARKHFGQELSPTERIEAQTAARTMVIFFSVALVSVGLVGLMLLFQPNHHGPWMLVAGLVYNLYFPLFFWSYYRQGRELESLKKSML